MEIFKSIATNVKNFNLSDFLSGIFKKKEVENFMLNSIKNRLYYKGETGSGQKLKTDKSNKYSYADATMDLKAYFNQRNENVTLKDTGKFYDSLKVENNLFGFEINADYRNIHENFTKLYNEAEFEREISSLNEAEIEKLLSDYVNIEIEKRIYELFQN